MPNGCEIFLTHDAAAANVKAFSKNSSSVSSVSCVNHRLNLVCLAGLKASPWFEKAKALSSLLRNSPKIAGQMEATAAHLKQKYLFKGPLHKIQSFVKTRWNSMFFCLKSILDAKPILLYIQRKGKKNEFPDKQNTWWREIPDESIFEIWQKVLPLMKRLNNAINTLSVEDKPSIHEVIPEVFNLHKIFSDSMTEENTEEVKNYCAAVLSKLEEKFKNHGCDEKTFAEANFLDPRYRGVALRRFSPALFEKVKRAIINEHSSYEEWTYATRPEVFEEFSRENDPLYEACRDEEKATDPMVGAEEKPPILMEWEAFSKVKVPKDTDVLCWWKQNEFRFPLLSTAARAVLSVPASSAASERVFSEAGNIVTPLRSRLDPTNVARLVYIHHNSSKVIIQWDLQLESGKCILLEGLLVAVTNLSF